MGRSRKLTGTGCRSVRQNIFLRCVTSVSQRARLSAHAPYLAVWGPCRPVTDCGTTLGGGVIRIFEDRPTSFPKYDSCGSQSPPWRLSNRHYDSGKCRLVGEIHIRRATLQHCLKSIRVTIRLNAYPLETVTAFTYLGSTVTYNNSDWVALYQNIRKLQQQ